MNNPWLQTYSGLQFWPFEPSPNDVDIDDIAHALANLCRFSGHCKSFYSVAQHSVLVSNTCNQADALWGLLHDAAEAYIVDVPAPIKRHLPAYNALEERIMGAICSRFGLGLTMPQSVRDADLVLLSTEKRDLMGPPPASWGPLPQPLLETIYPWGPHVAKDNFLKRFRVLVYGYD